MPSPFENRPRPAPAASAPADPVARSQARRVTERRNLAARSLTSLVIFGLIVLGFILFRRDGQAQKQFVDSLTQYIAVLNERLDRQRAENWDRLLLPAEWQVPDAQLKPPIPFEVFRRYDAAIRIYAETSGKPTIIAWTDQPVVMMVHADGRPVAVYEAGRVRVEWLSEREFGRRFTEQQEQIESTIVK